MALTIEEYLAELPVDRRGALEGVREVILDHLPEGYEETMQYGMIAYVIPLERYPATYNSQALMYAGLASQKTYMSLYLMNIYSDPATEQWFVEQYEASGKKLKIVEKPRRAGDPPELIAVADRVREVLGWTPKFDDLDIIVQTSLDWERKIAARDPNAYWAS